MKRAFRETVLILACSSLTLTAPIIAQAPAPAVEAAAVSIQRTSLQWTEMKGKRTQIFIDLHETGHPTYRGVIGGFAPALLVQLSGDGSAELLEYEGSGDDWKWVPLPAHVALTHPSPGTDRVDFDTAPLAPGRSFSVIFRSLNDAWAPIASSKILPWHPS